LIELKGSDAIERVKAVKERLRRIPSNGIGFGLLRYMVEDPEIVNKFAALPRPHIAFLYLGQFDQLSSGAPLLVAAKESPGALRSPGGKRGHLLEISSFINGGKLLLNVAYSRNLHLRSTIDRFAGDAIDALRQLVDRSRSVAAVQHAPSDFPGAQLTQEQLDRVMAKFGNSPAGSLNK
jgi:non-ribosomal peptide synthase protein (TIGR01720 family)